jgi:hypothetical protein
MTLSAIANRLAHQFSTLRAHFRRRAEFRREFGRVFNAAKSRSPAEAHEVAIHEAGHAALYLALGLDFWVVSIIPDVRGKTLGHVLPKHDPTAGPGMPSREALYLRHAMVYYAGAEAVRQLIPTHPNPDSGGSADKRNAANVIAQHVVGDAGSIDFLLSLAKRRCALLVTHYQPEVEALARALETGLILDAKSARKVFITSLTKRSGRLMSFKADPTLDGLAGDAAFQAFRRRLTLQ